MSIDAGAQVAIILLICGPCVVILNCLGQVLYLGRAPLTKETLPDFHEWCRVTRHPQVFCGLTIVNGHPGFGASHVLYPVAVDYKVYTSSIHGSVQHLQYFHCFIRLQTRKRILHKQNRPKSLQVST